MGSGFRVIGTGEEGPDGRGGITRRRVQVMYVEVRQRLSTENGARLPTYLDTAPVRL